MTEFLSSIHGVLFGITYLIYTTLLIYFFKWLIKYDWTYFKSEIPYGELNAVELSLIQNGIQQLIETSLFSLWIRKYISIRETEIRETELIPVFYLDSENIIYQLFNRPRDYYRIHKTKYIINSLKRLSQPIFQKLKQQNLIATGLILIYKYSITLVGLIFILSPAILRFYGNIQYNKSNIWLIIIIVQVIFAWLVVFFKIPKKTANGMRILKHYEKDLGGKKYVFESETGDLELIDINRLEEYLQLKAVRGNSLYWDVKSREEGKRMAEGFKTD
jgi:hypothetical protein